MGAGTSKSTIIRKPSKTFFGPSPEDYYTNVVSSTPSPPPYSEKRTRIELIDPKLRAAGWVIVPFTADLNPSAYDACAVEEYETANGPADYALFVNGRIVGLVEAKKPSVNPQEVLTQDERYARGIPESPWNFDGLRVPFLYATNGYLISFRDVRDRLNRSRTIAAFHTPGALLERLHDARDEALRRLQALPITSQRIRPYQVDANLAIEQGIADRRQLMLVAMATGTGKTFTLVHEVYRLMKAGVARRVLFLVDRRALAAQAVRAFASFEAEPGLKFDKIYEVYSQSISAVDGEEGFDPKVMPREYLEDAGPDRAFVYVCTIQRMTINLFGQAAAFASEEGADEDADRMKIPIHAFDLVIADEVHRGYTAQELSVWRNTLDHFDAVKVGLTATPAVHTRAYFGDAVYEYRYDRAVREGYLVDYDAVAVSSGVLMNGVFLTEGELVRVIDPETGIESYDVLEDERAFATTEIEEKVTAPDTTNKILCAIREKAQEHEERYGRFPKTLIFAANDLPHTSHADRLVDAARTLFCRGDGFVQKITGKVDRPLQRIKEFRNRKEPGIVVTVDLLSTGVDIPDLEFIVFLRPVRSRILFEQMMGRGTRKGEHYPDKSHFTVFDCFDGTLLDYFAKTTGITAEPPRRESKTIVEVIDEIWQNRDRPYNVNVLVKRLARIEKETTGEGREQFAAFLPGGDLRGFATRLPVLLREDFTGTMALLRDPAFQDLLVHYPRPPRSFYITDGTEDTVTSRWIIRDSGGRECRPADYLEAFQRFVREHEDEVDAIRVLLDRPQEWSRESLVALRQKLAATPENFTIQNLQVAHDICYHKRLVEIISMVKHAAREEEPLLTAEERVARAIERVTAGREFTAEQQLWLERIRHTLVENLSIDRETFEVVPVLANAGGWGRADRVFDHGLSALLANLNTALAS
jgi:type I restriction enzyme R subunit